MIDESEESFNEQAKGKDQALEILTFKHPYFEERKNLENYLEKFYTSAIYTFQKIVNEEEYLEEMKDYHLINITSRSIQNMLTVAIYLSEYQGEANHEHFYTLLMSVINSKNSPKNYEHNIKVSDKLEDKVVYFQSKKYTVKPYEILKGLYSEWEKIFKLILIEKDILNGTCWAYFGREFNKKKIMDLKHEFNFKQGICEVYKYCKKKNAVLSKKLIPLIEVLMDKENINRIKNKKEVWVINEKTIKTFIKNKCKSQDTDTEMDESNPSSLHQIQEPFYCNIRDIELSPNPSIGSESGEAMDECEKIFKDCCEEEKEENVELEI